VVALDVAGADRARALLRQAQLRLLAGVQADRDLLEVQQISTTSSWTPSMLVYSWSTPRSRPRDRRAGHRGQQHAAQRVAERVAEARSNGSMTRGRDGGRRRHLTTRGRRNSPMADCMLVTRGLLGVQLDDEALVDVRQDLPALGRAFRTPENFLSSTSTQSGTRPGRGSAGLLHAGLLLCFSRSAITSPPCTGTTHVDRRTLTVTRGGSPAGAPRCAWRRSPCGTRRCRGATRGSAAASHRGTRATGGLHVVAVNWRSRMPYMRRSFCFSRSCSP